MALPKCCSKKVLLGATIASAVFVIVAFVLAFKVFPDIIDDQIHKNVRLENGTEQFDRFESLPFPLIFKVYIFNVTNPDEILKGVKPIVQEVGPYVYNEHINKTIIAVDKGNDTITYTQKFSLEFDAEASGDLTEADSLTILNPPLMAMIQISENIPGAIMEGLGTVLDQIFPEENNGVFVTKTVRSILFNGEDFCSPELNTGDFKVTAACLTAKSIKNVDEYPDSAMGLYFTFFNYKLREPDGVYTVKRGIDDESTLGHIVDWHSSVPKTPFWAGGATSQCNKVRGGDSTIYPPHVEKDTIFSIFATDICRSVDIYYHGTGSYKNIDGYKFNALTDTFVTWRDLPEQDCFCINKTRNLKGETSCFLDGFLDLYNCINVPVLLSFPHFLGAEQYLDKIDGLKPDITEHETFVLIEPNTGTPLEGAKRIQMNMVLRKVAPFLEYTELDNVNSTVFPLIWIEEGVSLPDKYIDQLNDEYFNKKQLVDGVQWALVAISLLLTVIFGGLFIKVQWFS